MIAEAEGCPIDTTVCHCVTTDDCVMGKLVQLVERLLPDVAARLGPDGAHFPTLEEYDR